MPAPMGSYIETGMLEGHSKEDFSVSEAVLAGLHGATSVSGVGEIAAAVSRTVLDVKSGGSESPKDDSGSHGDNVGEGTETKNNHDGRKIVEAGKISNDENHDHKSNSDVEVGVTTTNSSEVLPKKRGRKPKNTCNVGCEQKKTRLATTNKIEQHTGETNEEEENKKINCHKIIRNLNNTIQNLSEQTPSITIKDFCVHVHVSTPTLQDVGCDTKTSDGGGSATNI
uniref:Uncharacterized protein n=1 Tax=Melicertus latisulcatus pemonivirus TaxID=2984278 RepID=A0A9C7EYM7_9VIRU|nr:MAG: hypothetical protein [Melicertus latisulcatus pemonivirus]